MKLFLMLFLLIPFFPNAQTNQPKTPQDVVNLIKKNVTCDWATLTYFQNTFLGLRNEDHNEDEIKKAEGTN